MNWEKLITNQCPYCKEDLYQDGNCFRCTICKFVISAERKEAIESHRGNPEKKGIRLRWQNLRDHKCIVCAANLDWSKFHRDVLVCTYRECAFRIGLQQYLLIMQNPDHPANLFYEREKIQKHGISNE